MSTLLAPTRRKLKPGTTGWSADDLLDTTIEQQWDSGAYEIVEGVLTVVPPAQFDAGWSLMRLVTHVTNFMQSHELRGGFVAECNLVIGKHRVARCDAVLVMEADLPKHRGTSLVSKRYKRKGAIGRLTEPPTLIIELVSPGHEHHDREVKRRWYEEARVPHYWILDEVKRTLECLRHDGDAFVLDAKGRGNETVRPSLFKGLSITLKEIWI